MAFLFFFLCLFLFSICLRECEVCDCVNVGSVLVNFSWGTEGSANTHTHTPPVRLNSVFIYHFVPFITTWLCALCVCAALCSVFMFTDFDWPAVLTVILISVPFILFFHCLLGLLIKWLFKVKCCCFFILLLSLKRVLLIHHFVGGKKQNYKTLSLPLFNNMIHLRRVCIFPHAFTSQFLHPQKFS